MKACYVPKRFNSKSMVLLNHILKIMDHYAAKGFDLSVRQLFYQLVSKNIVPNRQKQYKSLVGLVNDGRLAGILDWDIVDRTRNAFRPRNWNNPGQMAKEMAGSFKIDKWANQPYYIEVMVEKQALEGILLPICTELDITFMANKGYSSASAFYRSGQRFARRAAEGKKLKILYLGDHDPSGIDMTRDVLERVPLLGGTPLTTICMPIPLDIDIQRLALNIEQVREFKPPKNPAKQTDSWCEKYVAEFGPDSWELDAVDPDVLAQLVRDAVMAVRDEDLWAEACAKEEQMRKELTKFAKRYDKKPRKPRRKK